jgi:hypothetical protein
VLTEDLPPQMQSKWAKTIQKFERSWEEPCSIQVFGMLLSANHLYTIGARDVLDEMDRSNLYRDNTEQEEHMLGKHGCVLAVHDAANGEVLREYEYDFFPAFDGLCAARGKLYLALQDGGVVCLGPAGKQNKVAP